MMAKRPPAKRRGQQPTAKAEPKRTDDQADTRGYNAPGHLGGSFDDAGYRQSQWNGQPFGFKSTASREARA